MDAKTLILLAVAIIILISVVAWVIYRAGFRTKGLTLKAGPFEAELERPVSPPDKPVTPLHRTEAAQEALEGAQIDGSTISAPAGSGARLKQKAAGEGSRIKDSNITIEK